MRRIMAVGIKLNLRNRPYLVRLRKRMRATSASNVAEFLAQIKKSNQIITAVREYYRAVLILQKCWRSRCAVYEVRATRAIDRHPPVAHERIQEGQLRHRPPHPNELLPGGDWWEFCNARRSGVWHIDQDLRKVDGACRKDLLAKTGSLRGAGGACADAESDSE